MMLKLMTMPHQMYFANQPQQESNQKDWTYESNLVGKNLLYLYV